MLTFLLIGSDLVVKLLCTPTDLQGLVFFFFFGFDFPLWGINDIKDFCLQEFTVNPTQSLARKVMLRPAIQPFLISIVLGVKSN